MHRPKIWSLFVLQAATVLVDMGISSRYMALSLLAFNLCVEVGQAVVVGVVFPILFLGASTRLYTSYFLRSAAVLLIVVSLYWFLERAFEVDIPFAGAAFKRLVGLFR